MAMQHEILMDDACKCAVRCDQTGPCDTSCTLGMPPVSHSEHPCSDPPSPVMPVQLAEIPLQRRGKP